MAMTAVITTGLTASGSAMTEVYLVKFPPDLTVNVLLTKNTLMTITGVTTTGVIGTMDKWSVQLVDFQPDAGILVVTSNASAAVHCVCQMFALVA